MFDSSGRPNFALYPTNAKQIGYLQRSTEIQIAGPKGSSGSPARLFEYRTQIVRLSDNKVVAERVTFWRYGGKMLAGVIPGFEEGRMCFDAGLGIPYALVFEPER
jgi:hypothetical protein